MFWRSTWMPAVCSIMTQGSRADGIACMYCSDTLRDRPVFFTSTTGVVAVTVTVSSTVARLSVTLKVVVASTLTTTPWLTMVVNPVSAKVMVYSPAGSATKR